MARKKKAEEVIGGMIAVVLLLVALGIMAFVVLLPVILVIGVGVWRIRFSRAKRKLRNNLSDFWLNAEEREDFRIKSAKRMEYASRIAVAEAKARQAAITKNKDGQYSTRSTLGKEVRQVYDEYAPLVEEIDESLQEMQEKPLRRWEKFNSIASSMKAFEVSLGVWLAVIAYYLSSARKEGVIGSSASEAISYLKAAYIEVFTYGLTILAEYEIEHVYQSFQMIGYSFGGAVISFLVFKCICFNYGSRFSPEPPKVTLDNLELQAPIDEISQTSSTSGTGNQSDERKGNATG